MRSLKRIAIIAGCIGVLGIAAMTFINLRRGPSGATLGHGGTLAAQTVPEFPSADPSRWVNGAPTRLADNRGQVMLIEVWHPS